MALADDIEFRLGARTRGFETALSRVKRSVFSLKGALVGLTGGVSFEAMRRGIESVASIGDVADKVGLTTEALQGLRYAAEQTNVPVTALDMGMQRFSRRVAEAAAGATNDLAKVLEANNIQLHDQHGRLRDQVDILGDYADLIRNAGSEQDKLRLAFLAFDSEGAALVNTLRDGRDGMQEMMREAKDLGIVLSEDTVRAAQELDEEFNKIISAMSSRFKAFVVSASKQAADLFSQVRALTPALGASSPAGRTVSELQQARDEAASIVADIEDMIANKRALPSKGGSVLSYLFADGNSSQDRLKSAKDNLAAINAELERQIKLAVIGTKGADYKPPAETVIPNRKDADARKAAAREAAKQAKQIAKVIESLKAEYDALGMSAEQKRIAAELRRAGVDATTAEGMAIAKLVQMIEAESNARARNQQVASAWKSHLDRQREGLRSLGDEAASTAERLASGAEKGARAWKRLGIQMAFALAKAALLGEGPLAGLFPKWNPVPVSSGLANTAFATGVGGLFGDGGYTGGASPYEARGIVHGKEFVNNARSTAKYRPLLEAMNNGSFSPAMFAPAGGNVSLNYAPVIDARGADAAAVARIEETQMDQARHFKRNVLAVMSDSRSRNDARAG